MQLLTLFLTILTLATAAPTVDVEERQLNGVLLCPLTGSPTCELQCQLLTQTCGQCAPNKKCYCCDGTTVLE
ncbi:hypothetical protein CLAFUW4_20041 [Fulvia fulva]|uniref:uncharacterized protein n=1 Tax=Passalora fulva TaxID=5499 RepID=UPI002852C84A|nr:uncharacterized protein CLAFUR5_20041 [Fulvia fulva]KAK4627245.1 hypothetical protein CLAFUR4_20041 [Fulvia fulva]KAK4627920.1 hypothetical protein CLAFUR0_20041 [Fulvia fulva]WMI39019.1 hypothetical protein CLAFUR5_20041 [Fulvia fulva]WPV13242.1 hypothetical protein CLAFUW4_20041 [Fulvia fulva]WPV29240.1 hypothetical protein CLAFUW7_20041 [Fulvia fulva]